MIQYVQQETFERRANHPIRWSRQESRCTFVSLSFPRRGQIIVERPVRLYLCLLEGSLLQEHAIRLIESEAQETLAEENMERPILHQKNQLG
jgi:hypothetical protein